MNVIKAIVTDVRPKVAELHWRNSSRDLKTFKEKIVLEKLKKHC